MMMCIALAAWTVVGGCTGHGPVGEPSTEAYCLDFAGHKLPLRPAQRVSKEEALQHREYCRVEYDTAGRLALFETIEDGQPVFRHDYRYHPNGALREIRQTRLGRPIRVDTFDESGTLLDRSEAPPVTPDGGR